MVSRVLRTKWCTLVAVMDAQDPNMFGMSNITCSVMNCCVVFLLRQWSKFYGKHVLTLIITFSAAVMDAEDENMFWPLSTCVPFCWNRLISTKQVLRLLWSRLRHSFRGSNGWSEYKHVLRFSWLSVKGPLDPLWYWLPSARNSAEQSSYVSLYWRVNDGLAW